MTAITYHHCYRILRVRAECEWDELRLAYRRRVRSCHPDLRSAEENPDGAHRDEEFKQVVVAYRRIARFRKRHGAMPPPWLGVDDAVPSSVAACPSNGKSKPAANGAGRWVPSRFHHAIFAAFVGGVCVAALLGHSGGSDNGNAALRGNALSVGMDPQSVVDVQGVPNYTEGSIWFYGKSGVIFDGGCVVGWENNAPFPLRTLVTTVYLANYGEPLPSRSEHPCLRRKTKD